MGQTRDSSPRARVFGERSTWEDPAGPGLGVDLFTVQPEHPTPVSEAGLVRASVRRRGERLRLVGLMVMVCVGGGAYVTHAQLVSIARGPAGTEPIVVADMPAATSTASAAAVDPGREPESTPAAAARPAANAKPEAHSSKAHARARPSAPAPAAKPPQKASTELADDNPY